MKCGFPYRINKMIDSFNIRKDLNSTIAMFKKIDDSGIISMQIGILIMNKYTGVIFLLEAANI